jgi:hypothetical protein
MIATCCRSGTLYPTRVLGPEAQLSPDTASTNAIPEPNQRPAIVRRLIHDPRLLVEIPGRRSTRAPMRTTL